MPASDRYKWETCLIKGFYPDGSVDAGTDSDGSIIHVGRAKHNGHWIPAKVVHSRGVAYVPYGGKEHVKDAFQYLVVKKGYKPEWKERSGSDGIPEGSIKMDTPGLGFNCEVLYVGRANFEGSRMTGKITTEHKCIFVPYGGNEHKITGRHDILIIKRE